jgi:hypothetical protein
MVGYTFLIAGTIWEEASHYVPMPYSADFMAKAMDRYHESAKNENERRKAGDKRDHIHLTYL